MRDVVALAGHRSGVSDADREKTQVFCDLSRPESGSLSFRAHAEVASCEYPLIAPMPLPPAPPPPAYVGQDSITFHSTLDAGFGASPFAQTMNSAFITHHQQQQQMSSVASSANRCDAVRAGLTHAGGLDASAESSSLSSFCDTIYDQSPFTSRNSTTSNCNLFHASNTDSRFSSKLPHRLKTHRCQQEHF